MNLHADTFTHPTYEQSLKAFYAVRRARLLNAKPIAKPPLLVRQIPQQPEPVGAPAEMPEPTVDAFGAPLSPARIIINQVAKKHGVTVADIRSPRRDKKTVRARHEAAYRMRHETEMSLPMIGKAIGDRDHTTVLFSVRKFEASLKGEVYYKVPPSPKVPRDPGFWTAEKRAEAMELRDKGLSFRKITAALGSPSIGAVKTMIYKLEAEADAVPGRRG